MKDFVEHQSLVDQKTVKWIFRASFVVYGLGIIVGWFKAKYLLEAFLFLLLGTVLVYFILSKMKMKTHVNATHLDINHPFIGNYQLPILEIAHVDLILHATIPNNRRTFHDKLGTLYRMFGNQGLLIQTQSRKNFFLGSQDAKTLNEKLAECRKQFTIDSI